MSGFHGAFATGVTCQQGTLTLPDTWFRPPFRDLLMLQLLRPNSSMLPCLYATFHLEYPLVLSRFCLIVSYLRFCHMSDGRHGFEKNSSSCTVSYTALPMKTDLHFQPTLSKLQNFQQTSIQLFFVFLKTLRNCVALT